MILITCKQGNPRASPFDFPPPQRHLLEPRRLLSGDHHDQGDLSLINGYNFNCGQKQDCSPRGQSWCSIEKNKTNLVTHLVAAPLSIVRKKPVKRSRYVHFHNLCHHDHRNINMCLQRWPPPWCWWSWWTWWTWWWLMEAPVHSLHCSAAVRLRQQFCRQTLRNLHDYYVYRIYRYNDYHDHHG